MAKKKLYLVGVKGQTTPAPRIVRASDEDEAWRLYRRDMGILRTDGEPEFTEYNEADPDPDGKTVVMRPARPKQGYEDVPLHPNAKGPRPHDPKPPQAAPAAVAVG